jgi:hypothetical protein
MISFLIPTVYKAPQLPKLIQNLNDHELITEIILYENAPYNGILDNISSDKLIIKKYAKNDFCNKAWNYGAENSKNHYYALCNDDILFSTSIIDDVLHFYKFRPKSGFIGMHFTQYHHHHQQPDVYGFIKREVYRTEDGWGCLIFNHKNNNVIIPDDLKQWCGDTYYVHYSKYPCYNYFGEKFYTSNKDLSTSTQGDILNICYNDQKIYEEKYKLEKPIWA